MKKLLFIFLLIPLTANATLTPNRIPKAFAGSQAANIEDGSLTDTGTGASPGNVGVGSPNPGGSIDVGTGTICINHQCNSTWPSGSGSGTVNTGTVGQEAVYTGGTVVSSGIITDNGTNVGVGSTNPAYALDVLGTAHLSLGINTPAISNLTTNGLLRTGSANGTLSVDTNTYLQSTGNGSSLTNIPTSVSNSDGTLTITPTTGTVVASVALSHPNTWTGQQTFSTSAPIVSTATGTTPAIFNSSKNLVSGSYSGTTSSIATTTGTVTGITHLASWDGNGNLQDSGIANTGASQWTTNSSNIYVNTYNVGIGTSLAPASLLDVAGGISIGTTNAGYNAAPSNGMLIQGNVGIGTATSITTPLVVNGQVTTLGTANTILNPTSGNVGVGSSTPGQKLDIQGTVRTTGFKLTASTTTGYVLTASDTTGDATWSASSGGGSSNWTTANTTDVYEINSSTYGNVAIGTNATTGGRLLVIGGNVGVGSVNPNYAVNVVGAGVAQGVINNNSADNADTDYGNDAGNKSTFGMAGSAASFLPAAGYAGTYSTNDFDIFTNATGRIYIKGAGNVGIGTNVPLKLLAIGSTSQATVDSSGNIATSGSYTQTGTSLNEFTGNVGVGSTNPSQAMDVIGTVRTTTLLATGNLPSNFTTNVGINSTNPQSILDVQGTANIATLDVGGTVSPAIFTIGANVGVGSINPGATLDVQGTLNRFNSNTTGAVLCITSSHYLGHCTASASCTSTCTCTCTQG